MRPGDRTLIGFDRAGYPIERNILSLPLRGYRHERVANLYRLPGWLHYRLAGCASERLLNSFLGTGLSRCSLIHLFNGVSLGRTPWVSTFETQLPRWGTYVPEGPRWGVVEPAELRRGFQAMAADSCRRMVALSECARRIETAFLTESVPDLADAITGKLAVLHPAQKVDVRATVREWAPQGTVRFCFVGRQFFVKGGVEMLMAFRHLFRSGRRNWRLRVVSSLEPSPDRSQLTTCSRSELLSLIGELASHVTLTESMGHREVLDLMHESDVSMLPTFADSYGYAVLESQAAGAPVISTNVRALPEINNVDAGWVIPVPVDELGFGMIAKGPELNRFRKTLLDGMVGVLESVCDHPDSIREKGERSIERVRRFHDPVSVARSLERIYDEALGTATS